MLCQPKVEGIDVEKENKLDRAILNFQKVGTSTPARVQISEVLQ